MTDQPTPERASDDLATEIRRLACRLVAQESRFDELAAAIGALERRHDQSQDAIDRLRAAVEPARLAALGGVARDEIVRREASLAGVAAVRRAVRDLLPRDARVLVIGRGDEEFLDLAGRRAGQFPQGAEGGFAGDGPATPGHAVAHLRDLVASGWDHLVAPAESARWIDRDPELRTHLHRDWHVLRHAPESCLVFQYDPSRPGPWKGFDDLLVGMRSGGDRAPVILDWETECGLGDFCPGCTVFGPGERGVDRLPYAPASIDIVAVAWNAPVRREEARRIASAAVVRIAPPGMRAEGFVVSVERTVR